MLAEKKTPADKHDCAGKNSCKGKGGCKTGDNGCKGKNSCKGKGGCATDGTKKALLVWTPSQTDRVARAGTRSSPGGSLSGPLFETAHSLASPCPPIAFNGWTDYGIGLGLRIPHYRHIFAKKPVVDWFEIISENFMVDGGRPLEVLDQILEQYRVVQHGVAMYFGSTDELDRTHLRKLKRLVRRTNTPWLSDHLCWGSMDGRYTHDLLPLPYTFGAAKHTAAQDPRGARFSRGADLRGKPQQLRRVPRLLR